MADIVTEHDFEALAGTAEAQHSNNRRRPPVTGGITVSPNMLPQAPQPVYTRGLSYMHRICLAKPEYTGVQQTCCSCQSLPQSKGIGRAIQVCNQTYLMIPVR